MCVCVFGGGVTPVCVGGGWGGDVSERASWGNIFDDGRLMRPGGSIQNIIKEMIENRYLR